MKDILPLKEAIYEMGLFFNQMPTDERITAYANALANYEPNQIIFAFKQVINSGSAFFPSLAEILKHLRPMEDKKEDRAPIIANEIIQAIHLHPYDLEARMFPTLSEDANAVIAANGGTRSIRDSENFETMKAQLERLARGVIAARESASRNAKLESIGIDTSKVLPLRKPEMKTLSFSDFLPKDLA